MRKNTFIEKLKNSKFDLEELSDNLIQYKEKFFERYILLGLSNGSDHPYLDLVTIINCMSPAYLAPAYHYNNYIDAFLLDALWNDKKFSIPEEEWVSSYLRRNTYQIEIQALLVAIKIALDRMVSVFSYYYKGISSYTTFGRINDEGKSKGFMSFVTTDETDDALLSFISEEYCKWIKVAVEPRDLIIHYNDLGLYYKFNSEALIETPIHFNNRLMQTKETKEMTIHKFNYNNIYEISINWYIFFNKVIDFLITMPIVNDRTRI
ncbi:hypothetical protein [Clostridium sp. DJ247]|uniref:hypothetical protein n=1 Tax=Clostridium sp. DJ247 TaxID=2726188 RepID=UPI001626D1B1|nr:hypothetical protein [Clostridium sp. DJ247]MBC2579862.1 hypothetical protein [Clostridium sp. DJ247]